MSSRTDADHLAELYGDIYAVVKRIPRGTVATYGQVAELAGIPRGGRVAGAAMKVSGQLKNLRLPWQRVVGRRSRTMAQVSIHDPVGGAIQRELLEREGVAFTDSGGIRLREFGWLPVDE